MSIEPKPSSLLDKLDLNLLRVFDVLMQERRVASAARRLQLSQPAVSNALSRLRRALGDELLTRTAAGMQATAYAEAIHATVTPALLAISRSLESKSSFDPLSSQWHVRLAMTDIGEVVFLPALVALLQEESPGLRISTVRNTQVDLHKELAEGALDLALGWLPDVPQGFFQRRLFTQRYVCLARQGHPLARGKFTLAKFLLGQHVAVIAAGTGHAQAELMLQKLGVHRKVVLQVPHFLSVPYLISQSNLLVTVPEKMGEAAAALYGLRVLVHPATIPAFPVKLFWHRRVHQDPANRWLRDRLVRTFGSLETD